MVGRWHEPEPRHSAREMCSSRLGRVRLQEFSCFLRARWNTRCGFATSSGAVDLPSHLANMIGQGAVPKPPDAPPRRSDCCSTMRFGLTPPPTTAAAASSFAGLAVAPVNALRGAMAAALVFGSAVVTTPPAMAVSDSAAIGKCLFKKCPCVSPRSKKCHRAVS